jgi:hypothetical protein
MRVHGYLLSGFNSDIHRSNLCIFEQDPVRLRRHFHHVLRQSRPSGNEQEQSREQLSFAKTRPTSFAAVTLLRR